MDSFAFEYLQNQQPMNQEQRIKELAAEWIAGDVFTTDFWGVVEVCIIRRISEEYVFFLRMESVRGYETFKKDYCGAGLSKEDFNRMNKTFLHHSEWHLEYKHPLPNCGQGVKRSVATESPSSTEADKITNNPLLGEQVQEIAELKRKWANQRETIEAYQRGIEKVFGLEEKSIAYFGDFERKINRLGEQVIYVVMGEEKILPAYAIITEYPEEGVLNAKIENGEVTATLELKDSSPIFLRQTTLSEYIKELNRV